MFPTLMSKTFLILSLSLALCYAGAQAVIMHFRKQHAAGAKFVTAKKNKEGETDLVVAEHVLSGMFFPWIVINVLCFIGLMIFQSTFPMNLIMMGLFTFTDGVTLGIMLMAIDENLAIKVAWLTALLTVIAGSIGIITTIDLSFLGVFLFWALIGLILVMFLRIFFSIKGFHRRTIALIGVVIFVGYLIYDFNRLKNANKLAAFNNWLTALNFSIDIYLDIINLFLQLLSLLSDDN